MRRTWLNLAVLAALIGITVGCQSTDRRVRLKPPKREEMYTLPPADDDRFTKSTDYPKQAQPPESVKAKEPVAPPPNMRGPTGPRFGGGAGPAGY